MTRNSRRAVGAAIAGMLAAVVPTANADTVSGPTGATTGSGSSPGGLATTAPLASSILECLAQDGYRIGGPATVTVPPEGATTPATAAGTAPATVTGATGTIPVPVTSGTGSGPVPVTGTTSTAPIPVTATNGTISVPGLGTVALPGNGLSGTAGFDCGRVVVNSTVYLVFVTNTTTTTTTTANGPQTAANGPVTISSGSPGTTTGATAPVPGGKKSTRPTAPHKKRVPKRSGHLRPMHHKGGFRMVLVRLHWR